jgi:hypothetical protein
MAIMVIAVTLFGPNASECIWPIWRLLGPDLEDGGEVDLANSISRHQDVRRNSHANPVGPETG